MASCPIKNSIEWKRIMKQAQQNEQRALELWVEEGFAENPDLNEDVESEDEQDAKKADQTQPVVDEEGIEKLMNNLILQLNTRIDIIQKQKSTNEDERLRKLNKLRALLKNIQAAEGVKSILLFIDDAYNVSLQLKKRMKNFLKESKEPNPDRKKLVRDLININEFAYGYTILDEISKADILDYFSTTDEESNAIFEEDEDGKKKLSDKQKLKEALSIRDTIKQKVLVEAIPLMADFLLDARSTYSTEGMLKEIQSIDAEKKLAEEQFDKGKINQKQLDGKLSQLETKRNFLSTKAQDRDQMIKVLQEAAVEEGVLDYLIGPLISSPDSAVALFAKSVKDQMEKARLKDLAIRDSLIKEFVDYAASTTISRDNTKKFNEGIYEIIEVPVMETVASEKNPNFKYQRRKKDEDGNIVYREELHFVTKFDDKKYRAVQEEWYKNNPQPYNNLQTKNLTPLQKAEKKKWRIKRQKELYDKIRKSKSQNEIDEIDARKLREKNSGILDNDQYNEWLKYQRKWDITEPSDDFLSEKWDAMYDKDGKPKNAKGRYHKKLTDTYYAAQELLPEVQRNGSRVPSVAKKDLERIMQEGVLNLGKTKVKEATSIQSYDIEFEIQGIKGDPAKFLPVYYSQDIDMSDVSFDLGSTVLLYVQMANKYDAMNEISPEISLMQQIISERETPKFTSKQTKVLDSFAQRFGYEDFIRQNGESYTQRHLDAFIEMIVYGEMQKAESIFGLSATKITNTVTGFSALTSIAADLLKGVANNLQGNIQLIIEAAGNEFFSVKNYMKGKKQYAKYLPGMLSDFGQPAPTSFLGRLNELYDPIQGDFRDKFGRKVTASVANKLFRTDTLFFNQYFGEHEIQVSGMLAIMDRMMVRDKETKEEITLFEAHEKYGTQEAFDKIEYIEEDADGNKNYRDFTEKDRRSVQDRIHGLSKKMHGVYNSFDKGVAQRYSLGRLALMYRKHMYPGYKRRYKKYSWDEEIGAATEGHYRTFWNTFLRDLYNYKRDITKAWATYSPGQKAAIRRTLTELSIVIALVGMIAIMAMIGGGDDGDDKFKKNYAYNFLLYEMIRMRSETAQYINPIDVYRTVKSPSAALSTTSRFIRFFNQILPWNITEEYKRKSGIWEKGDNKAWAYFIKLIGLPGYNIKPREAVKVYESLTNI